MRTLEEQRRVREEYEERKRQAGRKRNASGGGYEPAGVVRAGEFHFSRELTAAGLIDAINAVRAAAKLSGEQIEEAARALLDLQDATDNKPVTYTNRAARRARARNERKAR